MQAILQCDGLYRRPHYTLTSIMSLLLVEHLDLVTQNLVTKFSIVKLPCYYPYHPW